MITVETNPGMGEDEIKENDVGDEFNDDIVDRL
jgi:hypothetical protein